jgi:hypothetical protein
METSHLADILIMQKEMNCNTRLSRPKPANHAGLRIVVRNDFPAPTASITCAGVTPRELAWTAFGTLVVGLLCLLLK